MSMLQTRPRPLTVDQFLERYEGLRDKYELINGEVYCMAGGSPLNADFAGNIFFALRAQLRRTGCIPRNSDAGVWIDDKTYLYPDVAVYCDPRDNGKDLLKDHKLYYPSLVFEVLSPTTAAEDRGAKVTLYKTIETVRAIVLVDPATLSAESYTRIDALSWTNTTHPPGFTLAFETPRVALTSDEIFATD